MEDGHRTLRNKRRRTRMCYSISSSRTPGRAFGRKPAEQDFAACTLDSLDSDTLTWHGAGSRRGLPREDTTGRSSCLTYGIRRGSSDSRVSRPHDPTAACRHSRAAAPRGACATVVGRADVAAVTAGTRGSGLPPPSNYSSVESGTGTWSLP